LHDEPLLLVEPGGRFTAMCSSDDRRAIRLLAALQVVLPHTHMSHEFHALSERPVRVCYGEAEVWSPKDAGLAFAIPDAPCRPSRTSGFADSELPRISWRRRHSDGGRQEMRLLPQPIYRYAAATRSAGCAIFVLVEGTDPEVFLLVEARGKAGRARWMFAAARMNSTGFEVRYLDKPAWSAEIMPWSDVGNHSQPYTSFMFKMP
jgi:hypothetical protein